MNEEIDIIELLKRVKEGKAPKEIEIDGTKYEFQENCSDIICMYQTEDNVSWRENGEITLDNDNWLENEEITFDTKIKILDKPIIEDIKINSDETKETFDIKTKLNEIIRCLNKVLEKYNIDKI